MRQGLARRRTERSAERSRSVQQSISSVGVWLTRRAGERHAEVETCDGRRRSHLPSLSPTRSLRDWQRSAQRLQARRLRWSARRRRACAKRSAGQRRPPRIREEGVFRYRRFSSHSRTRQHTAPISSEYVIRSEFHLRLSVSARTHGRVLALQLLNSPVVLLSSGIGRDRPITTVASVQQLPISERRRDHRYSSW